MNELNFKQIKLTKLLDKYADMRVLIAPLDWGFGHATRCVPIIKMFIAKQHSVVLAGSTSSLVLLAKEFPKLERRTLPAYSPSYSAQIPMVLSMAMQLPKFIQAIRKEHNAIQQIIKDDRIDLVIADNRYGCWSPVAKSIFVTHQINILMPAGFGWMKAVVNYFNHKQIKKFSVCWVPDFSDSTLSGALSERSLPATYIGPLSRLKANEVTHHLYDVLVLLSGPEPQRTRLESLLLHQLKEATLRILFVRGVEDAAPVATLRHGVICGLLDSEGVQAAFDQSAVVVARSGYSTIMDIARAGKKAIFIPTPGQTEQIYLAEQLMQKGIAYSAPQHEFNIYRALEASQHYAGFNKNDYDHELLTVAIDELE